MRRRDSLLGSILLLILCLLSSHEKDVYGTSTPLQIETIYIENVLPSRYRYYTQEPLGRIRLRNNSGETIKKVKVNLFIPEYMSLPYEHEIPRIEAGSTIEIPLKATFNKRIFDVDEDTPVMAQIRVTCGGVEDIYTHSITILNRNTIDWREGWNIASFITPNDSVITEFTRLSLPSLRDKDLDILENRLQDAMAIYAALSPITYSPDPNMPYKKVATEKVIVDSVQYPRETLKYKRGDCDDLSVLYASCLEAVGIRTAFVFVPGHLFIIFNTGIHEKNKELVSYDETSYIVRNDYIWLPMELTRRGDSFVAAIKEGMAEYKRWLSKTEIIDLQRAWERFPPVALPPTDFRCEEDRELAEKRLKEEIDRFKAIRRAGLDLLIETLSKKIKESPYDLGFPNRLGIIYGKIGEWDLAEMEFRGILEKNRLHPSALNNLGNIHFLKGLPNEAISFFKQAERSDPDDGGILFNLGLVYFLKGDMESALKMLEESIKSFGSLEEAGSTLGFSAGEVAISLTGKPKKISKTEIKGLLEEVLKKVPEEKVAKEREGRRIFTLFAGTRGGEISKETELSFLLYWKE